MIVDRLIKIVYFIPTIIIIFAYGIAKLLIREIFRHHGILRKIISDRDHKFVSNFELHYSNCARPKLN